MIVSIAVIILLLLRSCGSNGTVEPEVTRRPDFEMTEGNLNDAVHKTEEEIRAELRQKVEEGMMNISMNLTPVFPDGQAEGNLLITNEEINRHAQIVEIYFRGQNRQNGDTSIYTSGVIPVGREIANDKLNIDLDAGVYDCTAYFNSVDDNGNILGIAAAEVTIVVQN